MKDYEALEKVLNDEFETNRISITFIKPLHDEDFEECPIICVGTVIVTRADAPLEIILKALKQYF